MSNSSKNSMKLSIYLSHVSNLDIGKLVYALLDTQLDTPFLLENTHKSLAIQENPIKFKLSFMNFENMFVDSCEVQESRIRRFNLEKRFELLSDCEVRLLK